MPGHPACGGTHLHFPDEVASEAHLHSYRFGGGPGIHGRELKDLTRPRTLFDRLIRVITSARQLICRWTTT
jgi:hypothetical protein